MHDGWPRVEQEYFELLKFGENLDDHYPNEVSQNELLQLMVKTFKAESGQFCLHDARNSNARKEKTALVNLSWKYTDQYISYYHALDPFIRIMPDVGAFRNQDLMPSAAWRDCEFNEDFIKPQKVRNLLVIRLNDSERLVGHIGLFRNDSMPAFSQKDLYHAQYLSSVFSQKIKQKQLTRKSKELDLLLKQLKDVPSAGVTVLDSELHQVYSNLKMMEFEDLEAPRVGGISRDSHSSLPAEVAAECRLLAQSLMESAQLRLETRRLVLWQAERRRVDVEIITLPVEQSRDEGRHNFLLLLIFTRRAQTAPANLSKTAAGFNLTPKEIEISEYVCQGLTNREISSKLFISLPTVATHVQHILHKAGIARRSQLVNRMHE